MLKFFRSIRKKLVEQNKIRSYLLYALGEILLVVLGILIALQVNNWNEERKMDERFRFGLQELHSEIQATAFYSGSISDKMSYQTVLIDSLLPFPDEVEIEKVPGIIQLFDQYVIENRENEWKTEYLEFDPKDEQRNSLAKALRSVAFGWNNLDEELLRYDLENRMSRYLQEWDIPITFYYPGTGYRDFIDDSREVPYTSKQLNRIRELLKDPSFIADLMTIRTVKNRMIIYSEQVGESSEAFLQFVQLYDPDTDYSIKRMEIIGSGLPGGQWATGKPMVKANEDDDMIWEIEQELIDGLIKFRADDEWILDWGKGESDPTKLVFKGGNIPVKQGYYSIRINIRDNSYSLDPIAEKK